MKFIKHTSTDTFFFAVEVKLKYCEQEDSYDNIDLEIYFTATLTDWTHTSQEHYKEDEPMESTDYDSSDEDPTWIPKLQIFLLVHYKCDG